MHGVIIGGGIGGLAMAAALSRVGVSYEVHEQADEFREVGAGLTLWWNALIALERLGAAQRVIALGAALERVEVRDPNGAILGVTPLSRIRGRLGFPGSVCVHRADLLREILRLCEPARIHLRSRCTGVGESGDRIIARFADGRESAADFVVGADGLRSVVRAGLFGDTAPRYAGYTCWRGLAPLDRAGLDAGTGFECWGRGRRFAILPCGGGRLFWWATRNGPANGADGPHGRQADVQDCFRAWHDPIPAVIAATGEILRNDILDRPPMAVWGSGRVTVLGDAAHPTTPNLGQGACQALEDAVVLAHYLRGATDVRAALRAYERSRRRRTAAITVASRRSGAICQWENPVACWLRNVAVRMIPASASVAGLERFFKIDLPPLLSGGVGPR